MLFKGWVDLIIVTITVWAHSLSASHRQSLEGAINPELQVLRVIILFMYRSWSVSGKLLIQALALNSPECSSCETSQQSLLPRRSWAYLCSSVSPALWCLAFLGAARGIVGGRAPVPKAAFLLSPSWAGVQQELGSAPPERRKAWAPPPALLLAGDLRKMTSLL